MMKIKSKDNSGGTVPGDRTFAKRDWVEFEVAQEKRSFEAHWP